MNEWMNSVNTEVFFWKKRIKKIFFHSIKCKTKFTHTHIARNDCRKKINNMKWKKNNSGKQFWFQILPR